LSEVTTPPSSGRVVVGVDDSEGGREALRYAAEVARWRDWTLHVVHAWHVLYPVAPYATDFGAIEEAVMEAAHETVREIELESLGEDPGLAIQHTIVEGPAAKVLIAASDGADLLVVGNRGRGGFSSMALGSVGQACVHHARCPVLVIRPRTHRAAA
jgi:nucleotide-binding universal stress UspA family protein